MTDSPLLEMAISEQALKCSCLNGLQPVQHSPVIGSQSQVFPAV